MPSVRTRFALPALLSGALLALLPAPLPAAPPIVRVTNPLTFTLSQGSFSTTVQAVERAQNAASFYNYFSASSHTGFEVARESKLFLYRDTITGELSLFFIHNIDRNPGDPPTGTGAVTFNIAGVPAGAFVAQSDDPSQGGRPELSLSLDPEGLWNYGDNTDGGVIDGLPSDQPWCITITPERFLNVTAWEYHYASGTSIPLDQTEPVEICLVPSTDVNTLDTDEGNDVSLSGEFDDADAADSHSALWTFDDGDSAPAAITPGPGVTHHSVVPVFHQYGDDGTYAALLTVTDSAGESGSDVVTVRVHNVAPSAAMFGPVSTSIGNFLTLSASADDPGSDDLTFEWDFGDGSPIESHVHHNNGVSPDPLPSAAGNFPFSASDDATHFWCAAGTYTVTVTIVDDDGGTDIVSRQVSVAPTPVGPECNEPPTCDTGTYPAQQCGAFLLVGATSSDPDGDPLTHSWLADCNGDGVFGDWDGFSDPSALNPSFTMPDPCGSTCVLRLEVSDGQLICESFTTVVEDDTVLPDVTPPAPLTLECDSPGGVSGSDPRVLAWLASATASDNCGTASSPTNDAPAFLPSGCAPGATTLVTFTSQDPCGNVGSATSTIIVQDTTPPIIGAGSGGDLCLWPPSHDFACFDRSNFHPAIHDTCETTPISWRFVGCASNQPEDGLGDGHTAPDCVVSADGAQICVRSERQGMEEAGRSYAVRIEAVDGCGNASQENIGALHVPRDRREHPNCIATTPPRGPK